MTYEEQSQYNALPYKGKLLYDRTKSENPHWSHKQIMFKVSLDKTITKTVEEGNIDVDPNDPTFWDEILRGAKDFLRSIGCIIKEVFDAIDRALDKIASWIGRGVSAVVDFVDDVLDTFFQLIMEKYDEIKAAHPNWSDEQIWTAVSLDMEADKVIEDRGEDIDPNDPDIIEEIIKGAMEWLDAVLPVIFEKVKVFFQNLLSTIGNWVRKGLEYIFEYINIYFQL